MERQPIHLDPQKDIVDLLDSNSLISLEKIEDQRQLVNILTLTHLRDLHNISAEATIADKIKIAGVMVSYGKLIEARAANVKSNKSKVQDSGKLKLGSKTLTPIPEAETIEEQSDE